MNSTSMRYNTKANEMLLHTLTINPVTVTGFNKKKSSSMSVLQTFSVEKSYQVLNLQLS